MNKEKLLELADFLESIPDERFNLNRFTCSFEDDIWANEHDEVIIDGRNYESSDFVDLNVCNTAGCIAGWAIALNNNGHANIGFITTAAYADSICLRAGYYLGLNLEEAKQLFYVTGYESVWNRYAYDYKHLLDTRSQKYIESYIDDYRDEYGPDYELMDNLFNDNYSEMEFEHIRINNKCAAYVLRKIANDDYSFVYDESVRSVPINITN